MPVVGIEGVGQFKGCHPLLVIPLALRHEARHLQIAREEMVQCNDLTKHSREVNTWE